MATFTWDCAPVPELTKQPRVLMTNFGDGYVQRAKDGINTVRAVYSLFFGRNNTDADAIIAFLDARGGSESFDWTPPGGSSSIKAICREYHRVLEKNGSVVTATFEQVFE